jgi:hypothetical protein
MNILHRQGKGRNEEYNKRENEAREIFANFIYFYCLLFFMELVIRVRGYYCGTLI